MGMKKACSCGYWNEAQQECLYNGSGCIHDDERRRVETEKQFTKEWIEKKANKIIEIVLTGKNTRDFICALLKEIQGK